MENSDKSGIETANRNPDGTFAKGNNANPKGRPKTQFSIPEILRKLSDQISEYDPELKQTILEGICAKALQQALGGDKDARRWVADRMEGKAVEITKDISNEPIQIFKCDG